MWHSHHTHKLGLHLENDDSDRYDEFGPDDIALILKTENLKSLEYRYGDPMPHPVEVSPVPWTEAQMPDPVAVLTVLNGYEYQACEHGQAWLDSFAHAVCQSIRDRAIRALPGYGDADRDLLQSLPVFTAKHPYEHGSATPVRHPALSEAGR